MSCPWVSNRDKKTSEKIMKYAPLRWELKKRYPGYEINQCNIILDVLGGWSKDLDATLQKLVGSKAKGVLKNAGAAACSRGKAGFSWSAIANEAGGGCSARRNLNAPFTELRRTISSEGRKAVCAAARRPGRTEFN